MEPLRTSRADVPPPRPALASRPGWWLTWLAILALACVLLLVAALRSAESFGEIRVGGVTMPRGAAGVTALQAHAQQWAQQRVTIHVGPYVARLSRADLGAQLPIETVSERLRVLGSTGNPWTDFAALLTSRTGGIELALRPSIDEEVLSGRIQAVRKHLERAPVAGTTLPDGRTLAGIPGISINSVNATDRVLHALLSGATDLRLDATVIPPPRSRSYVTDDPRNFGESMIEVETTFRSGGAAAGRARNIELAAAAIDGAVLPPGGELSFNERVGERSHARGFQTAKELANRRVVDGVGGGVCQVAATLHAAAFLSGLSLTDYRPHSRPVQYIDLGLDTMVTWPNQDMKIANSYPFAIRIRASARDGVLRIRLEGSGKAHPVEWNTTIVQRSKPGVQEVSDDSLRPGEREVVQSPIDGLLVRRVRTVYFPNGPRSEEAMLRYPPTDRIVAVGGGGRGRSWASLSSALGSDEF
ncbi:MAG TPA: VanW family protein [Polyangiales bacterium]|nr:VanW family protein [Polyangiales bacterium]